MRDFWQFLSAIVPGITIGICLAMIVVEHIEKRRPKTLNLPLDKLQGLGPGCVWTIAHENNEWAMINLADLEYIAEKASMRLKNREIA